MHLEVGAGARIARARRQRAIAHLFELRGRRSLLGEQGSLDTVKETLQPSHELSLSNAQL